MNIRQLISKKFMPATPELPDYVNDAIRNQQLASEKLISCIQLSIIIIFSILYIVSPKTFSTDSPFVPVPWILSAYFAFTILRLFLSYRDYFPDWMSYLSIFLDIALLVTLIWSFHLQYRQPASFYLKAPTLLYLFIFISLRTLRFQSKFVLITGIGAAIGWLLLLVYALATSPNHIITRNYVLYMTSNHILIGGEIDKIISILMVTAVLGLAVTRGQKLLIKTIAETIAIKDLSKFFPPEVADDIIHSGHKMKPGYGEIRHAAILHCDIKGFTEISTQKNPIQLMQLLTEYQSRIVKIIKENNGSIDKFIGDGILASFNAVKKSDTYVADAIHTAIEIMAHSKKWALERNQAGLDAIELRVTVTEGDVILGIVGDETRWEYTVIGDPVNLAIKLDKHCKVEHCHAITTLHALETAKNQGLALEAESLKSRNVDGVSHPINLAVLVR